VAEALDAQFVMVKINTEESPATARRYGVSAIPTEVILTPAGGLVAQLASPATAAHYIAQMSRVAEGHKQLAARNAANPQPGMAARSAWTGQPNAAAAPQANVSHSTGMPPQHAPFAAQPAAAPQADDARGAAWNRTANIASPRWSAGQPSAQPAVTPWPADSIARTAGPTSGFEPQAGAASPGMSAAAPPGVNAPLSPGVHAAASARPKRQIKLPAASPPLALEGYCPVQLLDKKKWVAGDVRYGVIHRGRTYLFASVEEQGKFWANPDQYSPVLGGDDAVLAIDHGQSISGRRELGVVYNKQMYLFSNPQSLASFNQNPDRYSAEARKLVR
jgi:protein disulfide-isomerase